MRKTRRESENFDDSIWAEIDRVAFLAAGFAVIVLTGAYFFIQSVLKPEHILYEFSLGIIANLIPVFLIFALSYAFLRRIQVLRSGRDTHSLIAQVSEQVNAGLRDQLQGIELTLKKDIVDALEVLSMTSTFGSQERPATRVRILYVASSPVEMQPIRITSEIRLIKDALKRAKFGDRYELVQEISVRKADLLTLLAEFRPTIVHISSHSDSDYLVFEDSVNRAAFVSSQELHEILGVFKDTIKLVVLNCPASEIAKRLTDEVDFAISACDMVLEDATVQFSGAFYEALGNNLDLASAFRLANAYALNSPYVSEEPESYYLFSRQGTDSSVQFLTHVTNDDE